jgi:hypothetical protein
MFWRRLIISALVGMALCWTAISFGSGVCRTAHFEGMEDRTLTISDHLLGKNTTNVDKIKLYLTRETLDGEDKLYIQSNFLSEIPGKPGTYSEYPTKIIVDKAALQNITQLLENIIFWENPAGPGKPPGSADAALSIVERATATTELYIDTSILGADGRPPLDLSGIKTIKLASDLGLRDSNDISQLKLKTPPPALMERIDGCCLDGRPPGLAKKISASLRQKKIQRDQVRLFSMVIDSGTKKVIKNSDILRGATVAENPINSLSWEDRLTNALEQSRGKTLIVLSHVSAGNVVVEAPNGKPLFAIALAEINRRAKQAGVDLILLGCNTATDVAADESIASIAGTYNTAYAARRLDTALGKSANYQEFLSAMSGEGLHVVVQQGTWTPNAYGATAYAFQDNFFGRAARIFRIWFMGGRPNG